MTIECSQSVHSIVLRMAQVNSNVFYKCYKYKKGGLFCQEVCGERFSDPAIDGVRSAVNGSGQLCRPGVYAIYEDPFAPKGAE